MNQIIARLNRCRGNRISRRGVLPTLDRRRYTGSSEVNMPIRSSAFPLACFVLFAWMLAGAQAKPETRNSDAQNSTTGAEYSGMYGFLNDGEFVQLTVEDQGHVIGFISRYADSSHEGGFLEHFLESGQLEGNRLVFTSKIVKGKSFQFQGTVERARARAGPTKPITCCRELWSRTRPMQRRKFLLAQSMFCCEAFHRIWPRHHQRKGNRPPCSIRLL